MGGSFLGRICAVHDVARSERKSACAAWLLDPPPVEAGRCSTATEKAPHMRVSATALLSALLTTDLLQVEHRRSGLAERSGEGDLPIALLRWFDRLVGGEEHARR